MQQIEASLSVRGTETQACIEDEGKQLSDTLSAERAKYNLNVEKMQNQLADQELHIREVDKKRDEALSETIKAKEELVNANLEVKSVTAKYATLEK